MKVGVILVGHGSKEPYNKETLEFFAALLKDKYHFVASAFMQINSPNIPETIRRAIEAGAERIVVMPIFLSRGIHTDYDIPEMLGLEKGERKKIIKVDGREITLVYGEPLGKDPRLLDVILDRIVAAERV